MTSKFTRARLEEIRDYDTCVTLEESAELARMALAAMDSEPVYQVYGNNDDTWSDVDEEEMIRCRSIGEDTRTLYSAPQSPVVDSEPVYQCEFCHADASGELQWHWEDVNKDFYEQYDSERRGQRRILYSAPQPAPEMTAIVERLNLSGYEYEGGEVTPQNVAAVVDILLQQLDDAVQGQNTQPAPECEPVRRFNADQMHRICLEANRHLDKYGVMAKEVNKLLGRIPVQPALVPDKMTYQDGVLFVLNNDMSSIERGTVAMRAWNACRAAMLQELQKSAGASNNCRSNEKVQVLPTIKAPPAMGSLSKRGEVLPTNSPVIPEGYVMVPMRLTAENGAKGALSGAFSETKFVNCPECFGDDECETCDGSGRIEITVPVTWTTIKEIWAKGVEHFAAAPQEVK